MKTVCCYDPQGNAVPVAEKDIAFRPAVYGIYLEHDQVLLLRDPATGLLRPPGSMLADHEAPTQAIRHHFRRVAGVMPLLGPLLYVENQYRVDEDGRAWHLSVLYYALDPATTRLTPSTLARKTQGPEMVPVKGLERSQLLFGYEAIQAGRLRLQL
ncbi:MAG: hypothetical protein ACE5E7_04420 [Anaerolineae bacterium]